ncbi:MAG: CCA tRNA nucleotidyltransferase [Rhodobacterales bacterium 65-51]|uniref:CCA tRNA nucleotidyltransferase n=1 Tax=uncultured Gemmobacter sp. TaxID=1095917 RepID=UPI00096828B6|nr:CCA tRNA nucleotidyltransferase [uncultured Gemmobacter sp.]OJY34497.1 MAG: CCA tRNA nucleotidyltransferase [Rhodobacterales bacterium 65-51]
MRITGPWIDAPETQGVCAALTGAGAQALFVGGCVRNALLGAAVNDIDIATDAQPETVVRLCEAAGFRVVPTGIEHGTVTVVAKGVPHEVTTFRRDVETDGRRATVAFSTDVAEDAARRDFTMNALYAAPDGVVIDPLGGLPDLLARRLRFVGEPEQRIREDYLRILRFFRFHAWYGDPAQGIDTDGLAACAVLAEGLEMLSAERVGAEMRKLLAAPDPAPSVAAMAQTGILQRVLPGADPTALAPLVHLEAGISPRWMRRLAVLGGEAVDDRWRLSRAESRDLALLLPAVREGGSAAVLGYRLKALAADAILARAAMLGHPPGPGWQAEVARGAAAVMPVRPADLMPQYQGAELGARLKAIEARWLQSDLRLDRTALLSP